MKTESLVRPIGIALFVAMLVALASPATAVKRAPRDPSGGIFFYAKEGYDTNTAPVANPDVLGNWVQFYWSEIEKEKGRYDWSLIESRMKPWVDVGKKVAFRVYWIGSGYWRNPAARVATPASVWADGAKFVKHADSGTEIPLAWDPIYQRRALEFLTALAQRYDSNTNVLFFDVTPGAETNPYRFLAFNQRTPEFKDQYAATPASDGRKYSDELWLATVREWIDATDKIFKQLPLVVTLNVGTLNLGDARNDHSVEIGQYAVDRGFYVGQNGLSGASYLEDSARKAAFLKWSKQTRIVFETLGDAGTITAYGRKPLGTLREIVDAANRVNAHYLLPYPMDVLKGTKGQLNYDPEFASALAHGARTLGKAGMAAVQPAPPAPVPEPAAPRTTAQAGAAKKGAAPGARARDTEPSWLMPPVEGANLHYKTFDSKLAAQKVSYLLYLPPGYESSGGKRYPVVYWLHGIGGSQQGVPGMTARMTEAINAGKLPPLLMVFVNGMIRSSWVDSFDGKTPVESVAIKELIPHMDATYRTIATRAGRMIEGFSMGGGGAAKWGFKHPELFGAISIIDGALHKPDDPSSGRLADSFQTIYGGNREYFEGSNPWNLAGKNADKVKGRTPVRIITRTTGLGGLNREFSELLARLGVMNEFHAVPDAPHSPGPLYEGIGDNNWEFYRRVFGSVASAGGGVDTAPAKPTTTPAPAPAVAPAGERTPQGFHLNGERWTYRDGEFAMNGILLKPEGNGPFPAVLISHGLGGSAESFGLNKAREMVKWGFVCIAPDYTHSAKFLGGQRPGAGKAGATKGASKSGAAKGGAANPQYATYGASEENLRRARICLELVSKMPDVDAKRLVAYGHSMGGFVTIGLAAFAPDLLKAAAISGSGVAPQEGFPAPSAARAGKVRTPFLILHGSVDPVVRPQQSADFKAILDKHQVPSQRTVYEGEGHPIDQTKRDEVYTLIRAWFAKHGAQAAG